MSHERYQDCIDACNTCATYCDYCFSSCLKEHNLEMMARCVALDFDCAEFCRMTAGYIARDSEFIDLICQDCAEICELCAEECAKHPADHCQKCAEACRKCAEECLKMGVNLQ